MKKSFSILNFMFLSMMLVSIMGCVKSEFDSPSTETKDPDISADKIVSLEDVMKKRISGQYTKIGIDKYVKAIVVADDKSGNFYKTIVVEDENSDYGISLLIDEVELHNTYPVGRRVFINVKDLWISDYNGLPQIGYGLYVDAGRSRMASIPSSVMKEVVKPGKAGNEVKPFEVDIAQLGDIRLNTLIKINGFQFKNEGDTYSDAVTQQTVNRTLTTCSNKEILLRNSGFADFANVVVPSGKGSVTAIYSIFGQDKQLMIRSLEDVKMTDPRCGAGTGTEPKFTIKQIRETFKGTTTSAPESFIQGVVISDLTNKNINNRNLVIQDGSAGILVRFAAVHNFQLGQEIKIAITGAELSEFNGWLQLNNVANGAASLIGTGTLPAPKEVTIKQIKDNQEAYESTLVLVKDATLSGQANYAGNVTLQDASGSLTLRTENLATFGASPIATGKVNVTGLVSEFTSGSQMNIRNLADVVGGTVVTPSCTDGIQNGNETGIDCGGSCPPCTVSNERISIEAVRAKFTGTKTTAPNGFIQGIVISDLSSKNITAKNLVIQDGKSGIVVRFTADNTFPVGSEIKVKTDGMELSEFNKLLQITNVPIANATLIGPGTLPTPKVITAAELKANFDQYESTLVELKDVTFSGAPTFAGTIPSGGTNPSGLVTVTDATGSIDHFAASTALFRANPIPTGTKTIIAIASEFTSATAANPGYQLNIRTTADIK
jgi:DNA-directed RNA polymerase subunit E'/Rpb7